MTSDYIIDCSSLDIEELFHQVTADPYEEINKFLDEAHLAADD